ncbi:hypothetical protein Tco_1045431 [Tanacetum coccineum]|uniref:Uncharacterized protein n=1 Tax=Tanacetum coccineum TaxID=301880 RepID=A0ABQ5GSR9_9ASTR
MQKGIRVHAVPPPYLLIYNAPTKLDLSYSSLEEFQQPEFEGYGLRANKSVCENSSNETKKNSDAPLIKEWVSDNEDEVELCCGKKKKVVNLTIPKVDVVRPKQQEKPVRKIVSHFINECPKPKENKAFIGGALSDSEDDDEPQNDATCLMVIDSQKVHPKPSISSNNLDIYELQKENEELVKSNNDSLKSL